MQYNSNSRGLATYVQEWQARHSFLVTMFIRAFRYENLMDYCRRFVENSSMNDTYRYISNPKSRLVLFLIRMLIRIISVTKLRIGSLFTTPANHGRFSCHRAIQLSVLEVRNYKQMPNFKL